MAVTVESPERAPTPAGSRTASAAAVVGLLAVAWAVGGLRPVLAVLAGGVGLWLGLRWHADATPGDDSGDAAGNDSGSAASGSPAVSGLPAVSDSSTTGPTDAAESVAAVEREATSERVARELLHGLTFGTGVTLVTGGVAVAAVTSTLAGLTAVAASAVVVVLLASEGSVGVGRATEPLQTAVGGMVGTVTVGVALAVAVWWGLFALDATVGWLRGGEPLRPFGVLVAAQLSVVAAAVVFPWLGGAVESLVGRDRYEPPAVVDWLGRSPTDIPRAYWLALGVQVWLFASDVRLPFVRSPLVPDAVDRFTAVAVGKGVPVVVGLGALVAGVVFAVAGVHRAVAVRGTSGPAAVRTVAAVVPVAAGGVAFVGIAKPLGTLATVVGGLLVAAGAVGGVFALAALLDGLVGWGPVPDRGAGFALSATVIAGVAFLAVAVDGPPLAVYLTVGAALVVWYAGELSARLGATVGRSALTGTAEATHAVAVGSVVAVAVAVAAAVSYLVELPRGLVSGDRAVAVAFLLAVAVFALLARELAADG